MRRILLISILSSVALLSVSCSGEKKQAKILVAGSSWDSVAIIDKQTGEVEWRYGLPVEYGGPECNSVGMTREGNVLMAFKRGARLVKPDRTGRGEDKVIWDYTDVADTAELQTARVLQDGGFLLGICDGPARLVELDKQGKVRKEVRYDLGIEKPHSQFRRVSKSEVAGRRDYGNYIIPVMGRGRIVEINAEGDLVREYRVPGGPFDACELEDGNLLVALGNRHRMVEVDRETGEVLERIGRGDLDTAGTTEEMEGGGVNLHFIAQVTRGGEGLLQRGNTMIANWQGYLPQEKLGIDPQLVEIDSTNNVVWTFDGRKNGVKYISAFYLFEE